MSKAFTKESDQEIDDTPVRASSKDASVNHLTADGAERLRAELKRLLELARPALLEERDSSDGPELKRALRRLDARCRELADRLEASVIVPPPPAGTQQIQFGATVSLRDDTGETTSHRLVGPQEIDLERGWISAASPLGRALLHQQPGAEVVVQTPGGERTLRILAVTY